MDPLELLQLKDEHPTTGAFRPSQYIVRDVFDLEFVMLSESSESVAPR